MMKKRFIFENRVDGHPNLKRLCITIEKHLNLADNGDDGSFVAATTCLRRSVEYIAKQYLFYFGEDPDQDSTDNSLFMKLKRLNDLFPLFYKGEYGKKFTKTMHTIRYVTNNGIHEGSHVRVSVIMLMGLAEDLDALLPQFQQDIPQKLSKPREGVEPTPDSSFYAKDGENIEEYKKRMREYQEKSLWKLAWDHRFPVKRGAPWVRHTAAAYREYPRLMSTDYLNWYDEQNNTLQAKMHRASAIVFWLSLLELLMDLAVAIGAVALVTWGYMVIVKELVVTNRIVMAYIAFIPLIGVYACILYFLWKATKNIRSKWLDY